jgi:hypothetical protein
MMPQIVPVNLELAMIVHVHELVCQGILHVFFVHKMALAKDNGTNGVKTSSTNRGAGCANYVVRRDRTTGQLQVFEHKCHRRTCQIISK